MSSRRRGTAGRQARGGDLQALHDGGVQRRPARALQRGAMRQPAVRQRLLRRQPRGRVPVRAQTRGTSPTGPKSPESLGWRPSERPGPCERTDAQHVPRRTQKLQTAAVRAGRACERCTGTCGMQQHGAAACRLGGVAAPAARTCSAARAQSPWPRRRPAPRRCRGTAAPASGWPSTPARRGSPWRWPPAQPGRGAC